MASSRPPPHTQSPNQSYSTHQSPGTVLNNGQSVRSRSDRSVHVEPGWGLAVVIAAFLVHCIVDGVSYSFAVFYVDLLGEFSSQGHAKVVLVGTLLPATSLFVGQSRTHAACSIAYTFSQANTDSFKRHLKTFLYQQAYLD